MNSVAPASTPDGPPAGRLAKSSRLQRTWLRVLIVVLVLPLYLSGISGDSVTHGDESYWTIVGLRASSLFFVDHDFDNPFWTSQLHSKYFSAAMNTSRNPKLGMYLIGLPIIWLDAPEPPPKQYPYNFKQTPQWNRDRNLIGSRATLTAARIPQVALGVIAAVLFFSLLHTLVPAWMAAAGALLLASNPLVHVICRRAMLDAPAYAFTVAAMLWLVRACITPERKLAWILLGLFTGAAISSKLNAGILVPIVASCCLLESVMSRTIRPLIGGLVTGAITLALMFALNPTLYGAPVSGLLAMFDLGRATQEALHMGYPATALHTVGSRVAAIAHALFGDFGVFGAHLNFSPDALLMLLGLVVLAWKSPTSTSARVVLVWLVMTVAVLATWIPQPWDRYFVPATPPFAAIECVGLWALISTMSAGFGRLRNRRAGP